MPESGWHPNVVEAKEPRFRCASCGSFLEETHLIGYEPKAVSPRVADTDLHIFFAKGAARAIVCGPVLDRRQK